MAKKVTRRTRKRIFKLLIVDDHPIVRHGLCELVANEPDLKVCGEASNTDEALRLVKATHPDIAIVDIVLDDGDKGLELVEMLARQYPETKTLVSSLHDEMVFAARALQAGAMGYISKQESIRKILDAIFQILHNGLYFSPRMADRLLRKAASGEPLDQSPAQQLTRRELQVFEMIGQGLTVRVIARRLEIGPKTVETHRRNIRIKLDLKNSMQLNRMAFRWAEENH